MPYRHCTGLLWIALLCCWILVGAQNGTNASTANTTRLALRRVNVTLVGVPLNWTSRGSLPPEWNATREASAGLQSAIGECPAGRYCPAGTSVPVVCLAGTYSNATRLSSPCSVACATNFYCPDPGQRYRCPGNTSSGRGAKSQLDCRCNSGYQCVYKKVINVNVALRVPYRLWVGSEGERLKGALVQAVADTAGVSVNSVKVDRVAPGKITAGGTNRRLLGDDQGGALLSLSVEGGGAGGLDALKEKLRERAEFRRAGGRVHWRRVERLQVLPVPKDARLWDFKMWRPAA